jgi:hypothetical protein
MIIDGIEVRKIRNAENCDCGGPVTKPNKYAEQHADYRNPHVSQPARGVVYFNGNPLCVSCFGKEILDGEHRHALTGHLLSLRLDD